MYTETEFSMYSWNFKSLYACRTTACNCKALKILLVPAAKTMRKLWYENHSFGAHYEKSLANQPIIGHQQAE